MDCIGTKNFCKDIFQSIENRCEYCVRKFSIRYKVPCEFNYLLYKSLEKFDYNISNFLISKGASFYYAGSTMLHILLQTDRHFGEYAIRFILLKNPEIIKHKNFDEHTPLELMIEKLRTHSYNDCSNVIFLLLDYGADSFVEKYLDNSLYLNIVKEWEEKNLDIKEPSVEWARF